MIFKRFLSMTLLLSPLPVLFSPGAFAAELKDDTGWEHAGRVMPGCDRIEKQTGKNGDFFECWKDKAIICYAVQISTPGWGGPVNLMVSVDTGFRIKEFSMISNSESPEQGSLLINTDFHKKFIGLGSEKLFLKNDSNAKGLDTVAGATFTTFAVTENLRGAIIKLREMLPPEEKQTAKKKETKTVK